MTAAAGQVSDAFALAVGRAPESSSPASLIGLEHEYALSGPFGDPVDFRGLIHRLPVGGRRLDPGDVNAYRLNSGLVLTCDGAEAEIASPPEPVSPGFAGNVDAWARSGRATLSGLLPTGIVLAGYSTHLSVEVSPTLCEAVAEFYARTFSPAFALVLETPSALGTYVRPRPGRLELCGEYADGAWLRAAAAFAAGSVRACALAAAGLTDSGSILPRLEVKLLPGIERRGFRVLRHAFGPDLYAEGRRALLRREDGGTVTAQEVLEIGWRVARASLERSAGSVDLESMDRVVDGSLPLGVECEPSVAQDFPAPFIPPSPFGAVTATYQRARYSLIPVVATWDVSVFRVDGVRQAFAAVPRSSLRGFLSRLQAGALDALIVAYLQAAPEGRVLRSRSQIAQPGLFDALADPVLLVPDEPAPGASAMALPSSGMGVGKAARRRGKRVGKVVLPGHRFVPGPVLPLPPPTGTPLCSSRLDPAPTPFAASKPNAAGFNWLPIVIAVVAALVGVVGVLAAVVVGGNGSAPPTPTPGATDVSGAGIAPPSTTAPTRATAPTDVAPPTASSSAIESPGASATPTAQTPTVRPTETRGPGTPTIAPTETPRPTSTPTPATISTSTATPTSTASPPQTPVPPIIRNVSCTAVDRNVPSMCQVIVGEGPTPTFTWTAQGGTPATGTGATFSPTFTTAGPHTVTVTACVGSSCSSRSVTVTIL